MKDSEDQNQTTLLPCPFCGGDAQLLSAALRETHDAIIECLECEADVGGPDDETATANWNRRVAT